MRITFVSGLCGVGMALAMAFPAVGQTVTPTPSPTTSPVSLPSGSDLILKMRSAVRAAGTGRVVLRAPRTGQWGALSTVEVDLTGSVPRLHAVDLMRMPPTQPTRVARHERIEVGRREAFRSPYGAWTCSVYDRVHLDDFSLLFLPGALTHIANVGEERMAGATVWHVTARWVSKGQYSSAKVALDFYIDEGTMLVLRQDRTTAYRQQGRVTVIGHVRMSYSNYGRPLHIALPKVCRSR